MQRRERILAGIIGLLAGGWILDAAVIAPATTWYDGLRADARRATEEAGQAQTLVDRQARIMADWRTRHAAGLLDDEAAARFRVQRALADAARSGGLSLDSVSGGQLVPATRDETCDTIRLTATGQGSLAQAMAFLAALEASPQPLRIERSELSAADGRKDALELSLTVSTRIVPAVRRDGRSVPAGTAAWTPDASGHHAADSVVAARPFLIDRRMTQTRPSVSADTAPPSVASPAGGWALVGIVARQDGSAAFLRHLGDGRERIVASGDELDGDRVASVGPDGLVIGENGQARRISVGTQIDGTPMPAASRSTATPAVPAAKPTPGQPTATPASDATRESILERLRQQRNRTP